MFIYAYAYVCVKGAVYISILLLSYSVSSRALGIFFYHIIIYNNISTAQYHHTNNDHTLNPSVPFNKINKSTLNQLTNGPTDQLINLPTNTHRYAKAYGCYDAISGGWINEALLDLTGYPTLEMDFTVREFESEKCWWDMIACYAQGFPMGISTGGASGGQGMYVCMSVC